MLEFTLAFFLMRGLTISRSAALGMAVEPFAEVTAAGAVHEHFTIFVNFHPLTPPKKEKEMTAEHPDAQETDKLVAFLTPPFFVTEVRAPVDSKISPQIAHKRREIESWFPPSAKRPAVHHPSRGGCHPAIRRCSPLAPQPNAPCGELLSCTSR